MTTAREHLDRIHSRLAAHPMVAAFAGRITIEREAADVVVKLAEGRGLRLRAQDGAISVANEPVAVGGDADATLDKVARLVAARLGQIGA